MRNATSQSQYVWSKCYHITFLTKSCTAASYAAIRFSGRFSCYPTGYTGQIELHLRIVSWSKNDNTAWHSCLNPANVYIAKRLACTSDFQNSSFRRFYHSLCLSSPLASLTPKTASVLELALLVSNETTPCKARSKLNCTVQSCFFSLLCLTIFKGPTLLANAVTIHTGVDRVRPTHSQNYQTRDLNVWSAANVRVSIVCLCCLFIYIYIYISRNLKSGLSSGFDELFIRWTLLVPGTEWTGLWVFT